jgi:hypothetical protein
MFNKNREILPVDALNIACMMHAFTELFLALNKLINFSGKKIDSLASGCIILASLLAGLATNAL